MAQLSLYFLGPFTVKLGEQSISQFSSDKVRALLAYLAVEAGKPHRRSALAGLLWPEYSERAARDSLRNALANLRQAIADHQADPPFLLSDRETIQFQSSSDHWLDLRAFERYLNPDNPPLTNLSPQSEVENLKSAVELYRGDFLQGFSLTDSPAFDEWTLLRRKNLRREVVNACSRLAQTFDLREDFEQACIYAYKLVDIEPWHEETHRQLMRLLATSGQRVAALAQYEACCQSLQKELEVEPDLETIQLYEKIRDGEIKGSAQRKQLLHNLPAMLSRFVGRENELEELKRRLEDPGCRLLTLVGPGGYGKTRLAIEAARGQIEHFKHGVYLVPLAGIQAPDAVPLAIGQALSFSFGADREPWQQILDYLRGKKALLVMDNFEHLLPGAQMLVELLHNAPGVKILATSRFRLNVLDENLFSLSGMAYPEASSLECQVPALTHSPSVQLFLEGVKRVKPGYEPGEEDLKQIGTICRLADGIPLVILLSASWCGLLGPGKIAAKISREDLDFLEAEWGDVPERQRSLRQVFDHSWELLSVEQQETLAGLSVFPRSFSFQSARAVTGLSLKTLRGLIDRSLVETTVAERYELHPLMRQYAKKKLADWPELSASVQERHCAFFARQLADWAAALQGPEQLEAQREIVLEIENIRLAWGLGLEHARFGCLSGALDGLGRLYERLCLYQEGEDVFEKAVEQMHHRLPDLDPNHIPFLIRSVSWQSVFNRLLGHNESAGQAIQVGFNLLESWPLQQQELELEKAFLLQQRGALRFDSDREGSQRDFQASLEIYQSLGHRWRQAPVLNYLARIVFCLGKFQEAIGLLEESLFIYRDCGDIVGIAKTQIILSNQLSAFGDFEKIDDFVHKQALQLRDLGSPALLADYLMKDGINQGYLGRFVEGQKRMEAALDIYEDLGDLRNRASLEEILGWININQGFYHRGCERVQVSMELARKQGNKHLIALGYLGLGVGNLVYGVYQQAQQNLKESISYYRQATQQDELGLALVGLSEAEYRLGLLSDASIHFREALQLAHQTGSWHTSVNVVGRAALFAALQGDIEKGVELYALVTHYPYVGNSVFWEDTAGRHIAERAADLTEEVRTAAQDRGMKRDLHETIKELLEEFMPLK